MDDELKQFEAMNAADLLALKKIFHEAKIECEIANASDLMPISSLIAYIKKDKKGRLITVSMTFMPLPEDVFPDIKLLQFYTELPFDVATDVTAYLNGLNRELPMGSFGVSEAKQIYFRYVHVINKYDSLYDAAELYKNLITILLFVLDIHADAIEAKSQ